MTVRPIIEIGHASLKLRNKPVTDFMSAQFRILIQDLVDTMNDRDLIGIAAPQIAENYRVFITHPRKTAARKLPMGDVMRMYVNPEITYQSIEANVLYEGCGCIPQSSIFAPVRRSMEIEIEAYDETGKKFRLRCDGILARVIQHEMDHLNGIEFLEKVTDNGKIVGWNFYKDEIRNSKTQLNASRISKIIVKNVNS